MSIAMIGTGYVGLVSVACFMKFGVDVVCVDKDESKIETLKSGEIPIYEPGLDALVAEGFESGRLTVTTNLAEAVDGADAVLVVLGRVQLLLLGGLLFLFLLLLVLLL